MSGTTEDHELLKSIPRVTLLPSHNNQLNDGVDGSPSGNQENVDCSWTPEEVNLFASRSRQFHLRIFCLRV